MSKSGFRLSRLVVTGKNVIDAEISFDAGFNVVTGPSNTGKSYIVECIDYMFGAEEAPGEGLEESKGYDTAFLEITTYSGDLFTLQRSLLGGDLNLYQASFADRAGVTPRILAVATQTKKGETLSSFLLGLIGINDIKVRTTALGELGNLTFRMVSHLFVVDETSIIAKKHSPIRLTSGYAKTPSERAFNYLITGEDDHSIVALPDPMERKANVQGKKDLYDELIGALEEQVKDIRLEELRAQAAAVDQTISVAMDSLSAKTSAIHQYQVARQTAFNHQHDSESRLIVIGELLTGFNVLKEHYASDIERLEFISRAISTLISWFQLTALFVERRWRGTRPIRWVQITAWYRTTFRMRVAPRRVRSRLTLQTLNKRLGVW